MKRLGTFFSMMLGTFRNPAQEQLSRDMAAVIQRQQKACERLDNVTREVLQNQASLMQMAFKK